VNERTLRVVLFTAAVVIGLAVGLTMGYLVHQGFNR
jgi:hypothetical protein